MIIVLCIFFVMAIIGMIFFLYEIRNAKLVDEKDIKRQKEIIEELGCKLYRYNEKIDKFYMV